MPVAPGASLSADVLVADALAGRIGDHDPRLDEPPFDAFLGAVRRAVPAARETGLALGLAAQIVDASLADIERKVRAYGDAGIRSWLLMLLRFDVVQLGRLQFERAISEHGRAIHIPELGRLDPALVDEAIATADEQFGAARYSCDSWMLDPGIERLDATSNVRRFRDRFEILDVPKERPDDEGATPGDRTVCKFIFRASYADVMRLDRSEPRSSLQRAVLERFDRGEHWTETLGVLRTSCA